MKTAVCLFRWAIGFFYFCLIAALGFIGLFFFKPQQIIVLARPLCRTLLKSVGVRVKVTGLDLFDHKRSYTIICNHESLLDAFLCLGYIPLYFVAIELQEHFSWPVWSTLIKKWGNIPIDKENHLKAVKSLKKAEDVLKNGSSIIIFPEGMRTITGEMREFKKGAFYLAKNAKTDILPVAINGLYYAKTRGDWRVRSANVMLNFGKPFLYKDFKSLSVEELRDCVKDTIEELKYKPQGE